MAQDNARMFEILYGYNPGSKEPNEIKLFKKMEGKLLASMKQSGVAVVRQVAIIGVKNGLGDYLQYCFFSFHKNQRGWPNMGAGMKRALEIGRELMNRSMYLPNYSDGLTTPPPELESAVDEMLMDLGRWCQKDMRKELANAYITLLNDNKDAYGSNARAIDLRIAFENSLAQHPGAFDSADRILGVIQFMLI